MSVKETLDKIVERHPDVIGAVVSSGGQIIHNLEAPYDMISLDEAMETFSEIFQQAELLEDEGFGFSEMIMDFTSHTIILRSLDTGILAVLSPRMARGQLIKLHVGLALFGKAIQKDLAAGNIQQAPAQDTMPPLVAEPPTPIATQDIASDGHADDYDDESRKLILRPQRGFRGKSHPLPTSVEVDAVSAAQPKTTTADGEMINEDGVPLRPDGTPKVKRVYRGTVYYE